MALISCPECQREVSDTINSCPHCGFILNQNVSVSNIQKNKGVWNNRKLLLSILAVLLLVVVSATAFAVYGNIMRAREEKEMAEKLEAERIENERLESVFLEDMVTVLTKIEQGITYATNIPEKYMNIWDSAINCETTAVLDFEGVKVPYYSRIFDVSNEDVHESWKECDPTYDGDRDIYKDFPDALNTVQTVNLAIQVAVSLVQKSSNYTDAVALNGEIESIMSKMKSPPDSQKDRYSLLVDLYTDYVVYFGKCTIPEGSYLSYGEDIREKTDNINKKLILVKANFP